MFEVNVAEQVVKLGSETIIFIDLRRTDESGILTLLSRGLWGWFLVIRLVMRIRYVFVGISYTNLVEQGVIFMGNEKNTIQGYC